MTTRKYTDSCLADDAVLGPQIAEQEDITQKVLHISPDEGSLIAWGGLLEQRPGERLTGFQTEGQYMLFFVNRGELRVTIDGQPITVSHGHTLLVWPAEKCVAVEPQPSYITCQWLSFGFGRTCNPSTPRCISVPRVGDVSNPEIVAELFSLLTNEYHGSQAFPQAGHPLGTLGSHYLLLSLLSRLSPADTGHFVALSSINVIAERAVDYIRANFSKPITTADVAQALDCSEGYVRKAFKKTYNHTLSDRLMRLRMAHARTLLAKSNMSIGHIAQECGFTRLSYFTRVFTRNHGLTPSQYRANHGRQYLTINV